MGSSGPAGEAGRRVAVFLDRDGTVIEESHYLSDPDGVVLLPGAARALRMLRDAGFALVMVTNQSGIARGFLDLDDYRAVARRLDDLLRAEGVTLDATRFCPHHPDVSGDCTCRKPATGMHRELAAELNLEFSGSFFVGDRIRDLLPALELGGAGILVRTGYGRGEEEDLPKPFVAVDDLLAAALHILRTEMNQPEEGSP